MSRYYDMSVEISGYKAVCVDDTIKAAADAEWEFDGWFEHRGSLTASGTGYLVGGETEEEFARRLTEAIWAANGAYCEVIVTATYLENLPCEHYTLDEQQYRKWRKTIKKQPAKKKKVMKPR